MVVVRCGGVWCDVWRCVALRCFVFGGGFFVVESEPGIDVSIKNKTLTNKKVKKRKFKLQNRTLHAQ